MARKETRKEATKPPPVCKAILLCDNVTRDRTTGKSSVIGIFDTFLVSSLPGSTSPCKLFLALVDGIGEYTIRAEVHDLKEGAALARSPTGEINFPQRRIQRELWLPVAALSFTHPGSYDLVVFADDNEIDRVQFKVQLPGGRTHASSPEEQS